MQLLWQALSSGQYSIDDRRSSLFVGHPRGRSVRWVVKRFLEKTGRQIREEAKQRPQSLSSDTLLFGPDRDTHWLGRRFILLGPLQNVHLSIS